MNAYHPDHDDPPPSEWPSPPPAAARDRSYIVQDDDTGRESLIIYDGENELAWIQAEDWVPLDKRV